jgi:hypothetical protein
VAELILLWRVLSSFQYFYLIDIVEVFNGREKAAEENHRAFSD